MESVAYRSLKPASRTLLSELIYRFNGHNNGQIGLGVREATKAIGVKSVQTAGRAFADLQRKGFIVAERKGSFDCSKGGQHRATEWRLTHLPAANSSASKSANAPTKEFMYWKGPANDSKVYDGASSKQKARRQNAVPNNRTGSLKNRYCESATV
jgi:hypothetical protein